MEGWGRGEVRVDGDGFGEIEGWGAGGGGDRTGVGDWARGRSLPSAVGAKADGIADWGTGVGGGAIAGAGA